MYLRVLEKKSRQKIYVSGSGQLFTLDFVIFLPVRLLAVALPCEIRPLQLRAVHNKRCPGGVTVIYHPHRFTGLKEGTTIVYM